MRANVLWQRACSQSERSLNSGALVPLGTELIDGPGFFPFVLRRLTDPTPKHLSSGGPKPNPFLPWEQDLEVARLGSSHGLILNKYPVQQAHVLLISQDWQPQSGWLTTLDWQAVAQVARDTDGLWFFNSAARAGASQPHRHLQLLPRQKGEQSCPLEPALLSQLAGSSPSWPWKYALSRRQPGIDHRDLEGHYLDHAAQLGLGNPMSDLQPKASHNVLFCDRWYLTVVRSQEHCAGFSVNALGYAGYLLATEKSDLDWLAMHGPQALLEAVAPGW
ncbi:ATP adenylyltransferase [Cyanobium sp. HWJ4-Hawea]|uniref:ATP adenylyltransferase n=1 Tax=Cyanobium sp. HWJ4-Hawea TaxID=2823713 RepID=UPI0020CE6674|nr:ATP adenylyltransferase [Cyanobium sp. HWJ4-Hawea]MCP9809914.1 ATP adenylyltransferase [Cyanobium sp. HWJ4-Hawea]